MVMQKVAVIGECMVELQRRDGHLVEAFGGDTLNTALYLSRLTHQQGLETYYVTGLGKDSFSRDMLAAWEAEQINTSLVTLSDTKKPGLYLIETDQTGERTFHYWRNDAAARYWLEEGDVTQISASLSEFSAIYVSGISLAILSEQNQNRLFKILEQCKTNGAKVLFDNNYRPHLWQAVSDAQKAYARMLALTDIALLTFDDEVMLYGDSDVETCIQRTQQAGVTEIVIKRGADDCLIVQGESQVSVPATRVDRVVDTTAAGDSFSAGYLAQRLTGGSAEASAQSGHQLAGTVIQHPGAIIPRDVMPAIKLNQ
ncbi:sugar kinase [Thaumasiovibrio subtropicus]|uniref:sugar kinase n=1 Tax=Thaumasiovibrio subtropicus TaxID=1891207 RepID=UPI000B34F2AD|nr:sugar kinase [Thaumasiovibrio subtropicus]